MDSDLLLVLVVATALAFDFTNGFHDTANVVATSISTKAMPPRIAVGYAGSGELRNRRRPATVISTSWRYAPSAAEFMLMPKPGASGSAEARYQTTHRPA